MLNHPFVKGFLALAALCGIVAFFTENTAQEIALLPAPEPKPEKFVTTQTRVRWEDVMMSDTEYHLLSHNRIDLPVSCLRAEIRDPKLAKITNWIRQNTARCSVQWDEAEDGYHLTKAILGKDPQGEGQIIVDLLIVTHAKNAKHTTYLLLEQINTPPGALIDPTTPEGRVLFALTGPSPEHAV